MNRDQMINADAAAVAQSTYRLIDTLQHLPKPNRPLATAALFLLLMETTGLKAQDVFTYAKNLINHADGTLRPEFKAARRFMENEL